MSFLFAGKSNLPRIMTGILTPRGALLFFGVVLLTLCSSPTANAQTGERIGFEYRAPDPTEAKGYFRRQMFTMAAAVDPETFTAGPQVKSFRFRLIASSAPEAGKLTYRVAHSTQQSRSGSNGTWDDETYTWIPPKGVYRADAQGRFVSLSDAGTEEQLGADEEARLRLFFEGSSLAERMARYLDGRDFVVGDAGNRDPALGVVVGDEGASGRIRLSDVGPRWGRQVARFELLFDVKDGAVQQTRWTIDVDVETAWTIRASQLVRSEIPVISTNSAGTRIWRHFDVLDERQYSYESLPLDRSDFELVNPSFLRPGKGKVRDIALLPGSAALVVLEDGAMTGREDAQQRLGLWDINSQAITKVEPVAGAAQVFASENAAHILLADRDLSLSSFLVQQRGFTPFSSFLRYPGSEIFTAWDTLGVNTVAGTNTGRIAFINTGWDEEMGVSEVSDVEITGISLLTEASHIAMLDANGDIHIQEMLFENQCSGDDPLAAFCKGMGVRLRPKATYPDVVAPSCATEVGPSLRLLPGAEAVALAYGSNMLRCGAPSRVEIVTLASGATVTLPGDSFALNRTGDRIVTNVGVFDLSAPETPKRIFFPEITQTNKIVLADAQSLAFALTDSGSILMIDLESGAVVDDLTRLTGFTNPVDAVARTIWKARLVALMADGTVVEERPETGRHRVIDIAAAANLDGGMVISEAEFVAQDDTLLAALVAAAGGQRELIVAALDASTTARIVLRRPVSDRPLADLIAVSDNQLAVLQRDPVTDEPVAYQNIEGAQTRPSVLRGLGAGVLGHAVGQGRLHGRAVLLTHRYDFVLQSLRPTLMLGPDAANSPPPQVRYIDIPGQTGILEGNDHPMVMDAGGGLVAISNLTPKTGGNWNENGRIISVINLVTGEGHAELFQEWARVTALAFGPGGKYLAIGYDTGRLVVHDLGRGLQALEVDAHDDRVVSIRWQGARIWTRGQDGIARLWDISQPDLDSYLNELPDKVFGASIGQPANETLVATVFDPIWDTDTKALEGSVTLTSDGYYAGDKNRLRHTRFIDGFGKPSDLSEADIHRNRPDIVYGRMGLISAERRFLLARLHEKRLAESRLGPITTADLISRPDTGVNVIRATDAVTSQSSTRFEINFGSQTPFRTVQISNNGVDVARLVPASGTTSAVVRLQPGLNSIRLRGFDDQGQEQVLHRATVRYRASPERIPPRTYVFAVGVSKYADESLNLQYAAKDARDLAAYFSNAPHTVVETALDRGATRDVIGQARAFFAQARPEDRTVFFFAGHGLLDAEYRYFLGSHETRSNDLERTAISFAELESVFYGIASLHRVILLDACHSGAVDPDLQVAELTTSVDTDVVIRDVRGSFDLSVSDKPKVDLDDSYEALRANFLDTRSRSGASILAASGGLQFAYERGAIANGLFTHALLSGLRSRAPDRNADSKIDIEELFHYVETEVTRLSAGRQVPSLRSEPIFGQFVIN
ncbi:caspase family protein [Sulfitobacter sp. THAF37]|uniref:caspase family protein n=1 Tax=Sulfitobacter sp. THAF37 TaxID=2587855 RepID=UPI001562C458|nr:caspase family protein [Sulfitobacter sp. THAF37]